MNDMPNQHIRNVGCIAPFSTIEIYLNNRGYSKDAYVGVRDRETESDRYYVAVMTTSRATLGDAYCDTYPTEQEKEFLVSLVLTILSQ